MAGKHTFFPSGHTASAFAYMTPWVVYYPGPLSYSLYIIPVGTTLARIAYGKHWFTDVSAGALIGTYRGYQLAKKHKAETGGREFVFPPYHKLKKCHVYFFYPFLIQRSEIPSL